MAEGPDLSIIILNYNVGELLINCLESIFKNKNKEDKWQVIVVDNASTDGSMEALKEKYKVIGIDSRLRGNDKEEIASPHSSSVGPQTPRNDEVIELVENKENLGFSAGNNVGVKKAQAPVILFLNPDTVVVDDAIQKTYQYLMSNPDIGAITCRVELPDGKLDYSSHRGFPTPWNSFAYFSGLSKLLPHSPLFSGYTASYLDINKTHEIDCLTGAFLMVRKIAGEQINFWDTDYFWNGEDIEFCFSLKEKGWKIFFYPEAKIIHYKGSSSGLWNSAKAHVDKDIKLASVKHGISAMRIFYKKHFYNRYPPVLRDLILLGIKLLEQQRKVKIWISR